MKKEKKLIKIFKADGNIKSRRDLMQVLNQYSKMYLGHYKNSKCQKSSTKDIEKYRSALKKCLSLRSLLKKIENSKVGSRYFVFKQSLIKK